MVCAVVFHHLVGVEDVRPDLVSPGMLGVFTADFVDGFQVMFFLEGNKFGFEKFEGLLFVLELAAFVLAGNYEICGFVGESDC